MTHAALAPGIGREYDRFLFASIGESRHGHSISVISALAQSNVDPWLEAVGLARMSRELAVARLSRLIAALPGPPASNRPVNSIAEELVALLPRTDKSAPPSQPMPTRPRAAATPANARLWLVAGALALLIAFSVLFSMRGPREGAPGGAPAATGDRDAAKFPPGAPDRRP